MQKNLKAAKRLSNQGGNRLIYSRFHEVIGGLDTASKLRKGRGRRQRLRGQQGQKKDLQDVREICLFADRELRRRKTESPERGGYSKPALEMGMGCLEFRKQGMKGAEK